MAGQGSDGSNDALDKFETLSITTQRVTQERSDSGSVKSKKKKRKINKVPDEEGREIILGDENVKECDNMSPDELKYIFSQYQQKWLKDSYNYYDTKKLLKMCTENLNVDVNKISAKVLENSHKKQLYDLLTIYYCFSNKEILDDREPISGTSYNILFSKISEVIHYSKTTLNGLYRISRAIDPKYESTMNDDIDETRFFPMDLSMTNGYQKMLLYLLNVLYENKYRRYQDMCYEHRYNKTGYFTYSWKKAMNVSEFVYRATQKDVCFEQWLNATKGNNIMNAVKYLTEMYDPQFPELKRDRHVFSFPNGVYLCKNKDKNGKYYDYFYKFGDLPPISSSIVAANYFDIEFDDYADIDDWYKIPTPNLQKILDYQFIKQKDYEAICRWMYIMIGRMIYEVGEIDNWQVAPFLQGLAGTGKSTITKIIQWLYESADVGNLANKSEVMFGISAFSDKHVVVASEVKSDCNFDQAALQQMISGERVTIKTKGTTAHDIDWKAQLIFAGNEIPNMTDNGGSLSRRLPVWYFEKKVNKKVSDPNLEGKLKKEMPAIIKKCNLAYIQEVNKHQNKNIWNILPSYFQRTKEMLSQETNVLKHFLNSANIIYGKDLYCKEKAFKEAFNQHCRDNNYNKPRINASMYIEPLQEMSEQKGFDIVIKKDKRRYGGKMFSGNFIIGLDIKNEFDSNEIETKETENVEI